MRYKTINIRPKTKDERRKTKGCIVQNLLSFILCFLSVATLTIGWSQSIEISTKKLTTQNSFDKLTIQNSFDKLTIQTYAVQGQLKVEELFEYLKLISLNGNSPELDKQLLQNIEQLFSENIEQLDGVDNKTTLHSTKQWVNDWKNSKITVERLELNSSQLKHDHWLNQYLLTYKVNGKQKTKKIEIQIFFSPELKSFGETKKKVWELRIGNISVE